MNPSSKSNDPDKIVAKATASSSAAPNSSSSQRLTNSVMPHKKLAATRVSVSDGAVSVRSESATKKSETFEASRFDSESESSKQEDPFPAEWLRHYIELQKYHIKHGNIDVSPEENQELVEWIAKQKQDYWKWKGAACEMAKERIQLLENIGMEWDTKDNKQATKEDTKPCASCNEVKDFLFLARSKCSSPGSYMSVNSESSSSPRSNYSTRDADAASLSSSSSSVSDEKSKHMKHPKKRKIEMKRKEDEEANQANGNVAHTSVDLFNQPAKIQRSKSIMHVDLNCGASFGFRSPAIKNQVNQSSRHLVTCYPPKNVVGIANPNAAWGNSNNDSVSHLLNLQRQTRTKSEASSSFNGNNGGGNNTLQFEKQFNWHGNQNLESRLNSSASLQQSISRNGSANRIGQGLQQTAQPNQMMFQSQNNARFQEQARIQALRTQLQQFNSNWNNNPGTQALKMVLAFQQQQHQQIVAPFHCQQQKQQNQAKLIPMPIQQFQEMQNVDFAKKLAASAAPQVPLVATSSESSSNATEQSISCSHNKKGEQWLRRFNELKAYKAIHGNANVPKRYRENPALGTWVSNQRSLHRLLTEGKPSHMTLERVQLLESIGFEWSPTNGPNARQEEQWLSRLRELKEFKREHSHCRVPTKNYKPNPALGQWVNDQRRQYRLMMQGFSSSMTVERVLLLNAIGFEWSLGKQKSKSSAKAA